MPRLLDKLDTAIGRTPESLDLGIDYLSQRPSPEALIGPDGTYNAGWYERFEGRLNLEDSGALDLAMQRWFHVSLDTPRYFIVFNIADMAKATNVALLVADKQTGGFLHASPTRVLPGDAIAVSPDLKRFSDPATRSFAAFSEDGQTCTFSVHAEHLHLIGEARVAIGPPFVQVTRFQRSRGSLQWYGNLELVSGILSFHDQVAPLPPGSLGTFDRTVGHQRGIQAWNWIAAAGTARASDGRLTRLGLQVARDRPEARPAVDSRKYAVWVDGRLYKIPSAAFQYECLDPATRATGEWRIYSPEPGEGRLDLRFTPRFQRREQRDLVIVRSDFNQYYGSLSGQVVLPGQSYEITDLFAVAEESLLEL